MANKHMAAQSIAIGFLAGAGALAAVVSVAIADDSGSTSKEDTVSRASIPFADLRGQIRDWRDDGRDAILIESNSGQWYRAEFMSPCNNLPFAETVGFVLDGTRKVDKFGSILVRGAGNLNEECWFKSFKEIDDPDQKKDDPEQAGEQTQ